MACKNKLIIGFIYNDRRILDKAERSIVKKFGKVDNASRQIPFVQTKYYESEMGTNLKRRFIALEQLTGNEKYWKVKLFTNKLERKLSLKGKRRVNIDPGLISLSKLVLFTTKDYAHRLYLSDGIFAEVTLSFKSGSFQPLEYTYPDYRAKEYIDFFNKVRGILKSRLDKSATI